MVNCDWNIIFKSTYHKQHFYHTPITTNHITSCKKIWCLWIYWIVSLSHSHTRLNFYLFIWSYNKWEKGIWTQILFNVGTKHGRSKDLELRGAVLSLAICSGFSFWLYYLVGKGFHLLLLLFVCVCRVCLLLVMTKLFFLKFFQGLSCLFLVKLVD